MNKSFCPPTYAGDSETTTSQEERDALEQGNPDLYYKLTTDDLYASTSRLRAKPPYGGHCYRAVNFLNNINNLGNLNIKLN